MDKNQFTGLFLIMLIMVGSFFLLKPSAEEVKKEQLRQHNDSLRRASITRASNAKPTANAAAAPTVDSAVLKGPFGGAISGTEQLITLENKDVRLKVSTHGGRIYSVELKNYKTFDKKPLILFDGPQNHFGIKLNAGGKSFNTDELYFTPTTPQPANGALTMRLNYSPTQYIDYVYNVGAEGFKVGFDVKPVGMDGVISSKELTLNWASSLHKLEKDIHMERQYSTVYYHDVDGNVDYLSEGKDDSKAIGSDAKKLNWVSFKQHFFSSVLISKNGYKRSNLAVSTDVVSSDIKQMKADLAISPDASGAYPFEFYFGPNQFSVLKAQGNDLEKQINLGWGPLKYINRFAVIPVFNFLRQFNWGYGLIILVLTILLKLVLFPLTYKSYLSMAKMRVLKPEMDEIKGKVGEDNPTLLQQEYMKLYRQAGVNPLGGCLPLLLQMPIVIAFFRFFPSLFELRGQSFLWMHDLSTYDALVTFAPLPLVGWNHISLMCLLMTISTLIITYFNNQTSGATGQMKYIGYISPLIFFGVLNSYPAGLNYYYFLANMITFLQQIFIRQLVDDKKIHAQIQDNKKKPEAKKKKGGFSAKLEEMMRQQQAQQSQQPKKK
ncbi:membrane protein insertase YidC [Mucilaginibacter sp. RS28]|uniref:Membrane protein insertase YidC n=1 Tax=Mucilaginibacter straminoryzae TaxID=2932774 RepID=A0A9X1X9N3_9SPHI|nr:membrane protein insertase YidC [Mucilaginibacter straminoryzae]MCJ8210889.1 membrane protein insertase YidC [Mucilaginibacter straminoryzae]